MFKKTMLVSALFFAFNAFSCWFTQQNFNKAYIAGVNFYKAHYNQNATTEIENAKFTNGQTVSLPLTVWFKVSPRINTIVDDKGQKKQIKYDIRVAKLYYKIIPLVNGAYNYESDKYVWRLAKSIDMGDTPKWRMDFTSPVQLFGNATITKSMIQRNGDNIKSGDAIVFAWYIADNAPDAVSNAQDITAGQPEPFIYPADVEIGLKQHENQFYPAHVMRVIYNGKTTLGR